MTLQDVSQNHDLNNVDLTKIAGLQQKRTLAFVNHFLVTTVQFLNKFSKDCEDKLMQFERKLEKVNASMVLLESKLSSIPEVNTSQTESPKEVSAGTQESEPEDKEGVNEPKSEKAETERSEERSDHNPPPEEAPTVSPEYMRFVKMCQVGVPLQAVKLKMMLEGVDSNMLDKILTQLK